MDLRREIERKIEKKQQEYDFKKLELEKILSYIAGLQDALKGIPKNCKEETPSTEAKEREPRSGSDPDKARIFLKNAGKPLHISEILKGIGKEDTRPHRIALSWSLNSYASQGKIFKKTAPGTFGLNEPDSEQLTTQQLSEGY